MAGSRRQTADAEASGSSRRRRQGYTQGVDDDRAARNLYPYICRLPAAGYLLPKLTPQRSASRHLRNALKTIQTFLATDEALKEADADIPASANIWTVGHSTRSADDFKEILKSHLISALVDVRSFPGSRRYPHFNKPELSRTLESSGIAYVHIRELGGRRRLSPTSKNTAWRNSSFRAYADHMESEEFQKGINMLREVTIDKRTAIMCAEALWWRCHRSLIADFLKATDTDVTHILDAEHAEFHPYTSAARIIDGRLSYEGLLVGEGEV